MPRSDEDIEPKLFRTTDGYRSRVSSSAEYSEERRFLSDDEMQLMLLRSIDTFSFWVHPLSLAAWACSHVGIGFLWPRPFIKRWRMEPCLLDQGLFGFDDGSESESRLW